MLVIIEKILYKYTKMKENQPKNYSAELNVFGGLYSFNNGSVDTGTSILLSEKIIEDINNGNTAWYPRIGDECVWADLYKDRKIVAQIEIDWTYRIITVYTTSNGGEFGDTKLFEQTFNNDSLLTTFTEAVILSEINADIN